MAKNLGMDDIICSDLEAIDGYLTGRPVGNLCFDIEKEIRLRAYCEMRYIKTSDVWYYGDSISDLPALNLAGNPVCINPDNKLKRIALQRGWKILWWN
jgi:Phosphoserine phosphatase